MFWKGASHLHPYSLHVVFDASQREWLRNFFGSECSRKISFKCRGTWMWRCVFGNYNMNIHANCEALHVHVSYEVWTENYYITLWEIFPAPRKVKHYLWEVFNANRKVVHYSMRTISDTPKDNALIILLETFHESPCPLMKHFIHTEK
jgi:hypothetical protein